jgi:ribosomal protein S6
VRSYELITIHDPAKAETGKKAVADILQRFQVSGHKEEDWGDKRMPHDDGTMPMGRFLLHTMHAGPDKIKEIGHELGLDPSVVRYMFRRGA